MKVILTSTDKELRNQFNSESFIMANWFEDYCNNFDSYLKLGHNPVVGDYLYFYGNYYEQISVVVNRISYDINGNMLVWCSRCLLSDIDPYLYTGNTYSQDFRSDILNTYNYLRKKDYIQKEIEEKKSEDGDFNELAFYSHKIDEYLGIDEKTVIDHVNIWYLIDEILSKAYPDKYKWHRPHRWEYSDF